jgi:hypothetical protein
MTPRLLAAAPANCTALFLFLIIGAWIVPVAMVGVLWVRAQLAYYRAYRSRQQVDLPLPGERAAHVSPWELLRLSSRYPG